MVHRQNVPRQNVPRQNVPKDKTSKGQNVLRHKVPRTKRPKRQNVPRDKTSQETKRPKEKKFHISISNFFKNRFCLLFLKMGHIQYVRYYYFGQVRQGHSFILAILD